MDMKKRTLLRIGILILILVVTILVSIIFYQAKTDSEKDHLIKMDVSKNDPNRINEIKDSIHATASTDMYQIEEEYDGRQMIQIKPEIQFKTVLAGILKQGQPTEEEIDSLLETAPNQSGVWIARSTRDSFLNLLKENEIEDFKINEEGYLYREGNKNSESEATKKLEDKIRSNHLYIIDISGTCYMRDELSGEIVEYPFEKMDPEQILEPYTFENQTILAITQNSKKKLSSQEVLEAIL